MVQTSDLQHHYSQRYNNELEELRTLTLTMGGLVEQQLENARGAMLSGNSQQGEGVVANDYQVNGLDVKIDERCTSVLVRRQPTAIDLRLVLTVIKITTDLERIGDEAKRVARMAIHLAGADHSKSLFLQLEHLGQLVQNMLHEVLDSFARMDVDSAVAIAREDRKIDHEYEHLMRQAMTFMMEDPRSIPLVLDVIFAARALERTGDRCCNICEYLIYFVKGKDVRHTNLEQIAKELL